MKRGQPWLNVKPPKMAHGDADRIAEWFDIPPWQHDFLNRLESVSMTEQFNAIIQTFGKDTDVAR